MLTLEIAAIARFGVSSSCTRGTMADLEKKKSSNDHINEVWKDCGH